MGSTFLFTCKKCGYQKESSGKLDYGFTSVVKPYICKRCNELVDVLVGYKAEIFEPNKIPDEFGKSDFYTCKCGSKGITEWDTVKQPCPKCGNKMDRSDSFKILWD